MTIVTGTAIVLRGDDVDTDRIIPARFLKAISFASLEAHVFEDERREAAGRGAVHPFDDPARAGARVLLAGANFGCGSSREHAPQAIRRRGIDAIVGESFAGIFLANAQAIGLPCVMAARGDLERLMSLAESSPAQTFDVDLERLLVLAEGEIAVPVQMAPGAREAFLTGTWDATAQLLERYAEVEAVERRLPY
jgi:3-isopropylmalate/(R)-2-methylmalate dehydratase small subunit